MLQNIYNSYCFNNAPVLIMQRFSNRRNRVFDREGEKIK